MKKSFIKPVFHAAALLLCFLSISCGNKPPQVPLSAAENQKNDSAGTKSYVVSANHMDTLNLTDADKRRQGRWILTGKLEHRSDFAPEAKVAEGEYTNNLKTGPWIFYNPEGKITDTLYFMNGQQQKK